MATNPNTVIVTNISSSTSDEEIHEFFKFCGTIKDLSITPDGDKRKAAVTFEKETASKTALLLNNTQLGPSQISVHSASGSDEDDGSHFQQGTSGAGTEHGDELTQEEKPRTRIVAEYLAHGYTLGNAALERAIHLDQQHGISQRFLGTLHGLDAKYHATDRARTADASYGITSRANTLLTGFGSYFEKAANTPTGQRVVKFYSDGQRQVQDIHNEARRLAELKKQEAGGSAYKAAGLHKVFGPEKTQPAGATDAQSAADSKTDAAAPST